MAYRKTEAGRAAIAQRSPALTPALRRVLIVVNGAEGAAALAALGVPDVELHLQTLLRDGLIEAVDVAVTAPPATTPAPVSESVPEPPPVIDALALQRLALQTLAPHFGPDTPRVIEPLRQPHTVTSARAALDDIASRLAIYMGRRQAGQILSALYALIEEATPTMPTTPQRSSNGAPK
ncbi:MAG: hypothetical protein KF871_04110 [Hydrogenophaga sp.]|uniref:hypothetical protein n=1 Tax=Hydrogenophaga sp. TaxID=1904254 RepID=UPI001DD3C28C|nr:hypothetical protein [Hydrogenophaga sp.]MBX3609058.1 hypothetical protein [Hydrogenophaga sp.]